MLVSLRLNREDTFTRCNKFSSKLDIYRSFIRIFAVNFRNLIQYEKTDCISFAYG